MLIALLVFIVTIVLVIWQPKGLGVGWSASLGAALALLSGVVSLGDIPRDGISFGTPRRRSSL
jgi:arsenical pump membrane protein